ncbi:hypothetical protein IAT38_003822 [Cryptococcus sp. DSM 104549]
MFQDRPTTPSSAGLGISFANLASPPKSPSPLRLSTMAPKQPQSSPTRPQQPRLKVRTDSQSNLQPAFTLRPTHTKAPGAASLRTLHSTPPRPMGPRRASVAASPKVDRSSPRVEPDETLFSPSVEGHEQEEETPKQKNRQLAATPTRSPSAASTATSSSKQSRRMRSSEMLRKLSMGHGGAAGGGYVSLSGVDEMSPPRAERETSPTETITPLRRLPTTREVEPVSPEQTLAQSPTATSPRPESQRAQSYESTPQQTSHSFSPSTHTFPLPPSHYPPSDEVWSTHPEPPHAAAFPRPQPTSQPMPRSRSQPQYLYSVPEFFDPSYTSRPLSHGNAYPSRREPDVDERRSHEEPFARVTSLEHQAQQPAPRHNPPASHPMANQRSATSNGSHGEYDLRARPWSDSTMSEHMAPTLGQRGRSLSDGAELLARQGTLLHPGSTTQRASAELGVLLGGPRSRRLSQDKLLPPPPEEAAQAAWEKNSKVRLEASKKGRARVEVDVVLERECVVEGGEVRGRMEVRITGGKNGEGLRVGNGKVRVVGFEELSSTSRHIFYHQPHALHVFDPSVQHNLSSSLFASGPDSDGYRLAAEGTHSIPFRMRLPIGGGAKGTYTPPNGKGACVRYVVVGSIKIHIPNNGKRSIAHFYRSIVVLPYLNPSMVLAPSQQPVEAYVEKGLGWSLKGEKGRVELRVSLGRRIWVSGQRLWCEVGIRNDSAKKIKALNLAILQTVQVFGLQGNEGERSGIIKRHRPLSGCLDAPADLSVAGSPPEVQRRKVSEEMVEADFTDKGAGRVTGKGWWTGVEPGDSGHWDMSIQIPSGMLSIRRSRLIDVNYTLRVTLNNNIFVDLPVQLINFLSIDPPPMPSDGAREASRPAMEQRVSANPTQQSRPVPTRGTSQSTVDTIPAPAARASSTTLHIDAILQSSRARAEAEAQGSMPHLPQAHQSRPMSVASSRYTADRVEPPPFNRSHSNPAPAFMFEANLLSIPASTRSEAHSSISGLDYDVEEDEDAMDKAAVAARRAQGRQKSLAIIQAEMEREAQMREKEDMAMSPKSEATDITEEHDDTESMADHMSREGQYSMMEQTPASQAESVHRTPLPVVIEGMGNLELSEVGEVDVVDAVDEGGAGVAVGKDFEKDVKQQEHWARDDDAEPTARIYSAREDSPPFAAESQDWLADDMEVGNGTVLSDLVEEDREELEDIISHQGHDTGTYDYPNELDYDPGFVPASSQSFQRLPLLPPGAASPVGSPPQGFDLPGDGEAASEMGHDEAEGEAEVQEAVVRNVSVRTPSRLVSLLGSERGSESGDADDEGREARRGSDASSLSRRVSKSSLVPERRESTLSQRLEAALGQPAAAAPPSRRESTAPASPIQPAPGSKDQPIVPHVVRKKNSFSFATPGSPLKVKIPASPQLSRASPIVSPTKATSMARGLSASSQLKHDAGAWRSGASSPVASGDDTHVPGLAPSIVSDSASSEGKWLDSPPTTDAQQVASPSPSITAPSSIGYQSFPPLINTSSMSYEPDWGSSHKLASPFNSISRPTVADNSFSSRMSYARSPDIVASDQRHRDSLMPIPIDELSLHTTPSSTPSSSSCHSILPSVKTKIAQLESRDEALRKFSVSSAAALLSPTSPAASERSERRQLGPTKRKSYTTALAPRLPRSTSYNAYTAPRTYSYGSDAPVETPVQGSHGGRRQDLSESRMSMGVEKSEATRARPRVSTAAGGPARLPVSPSASSFSYQQTTPKLDPFGLGFGSGAVKYGGEGRYDSIRSTSTTATDFEQAMMEDKAMHGGQLRARGGEPVKRALKAKVSGYWEEGENGMRAFSEQK